MRVHERRMRYVLGAEWMTDAQAGALAASTVAHVSYAEEGAEELLLDEDEAVVHVILRGGMARIRAASLTRGAAEAARERLRSLLPPATDEGGVDVAARFWWWEGDYPDQLARPLRVPAWDAVEGNYSVATATSLCGLVGWSDGPPTTGRLIVCHGPSGTGKTHAVQMLAGAWRAWADLHIVSDPEQFLANPAYLMAVAGARLERDTRRWRVAVVEDAGEYLASDNSGAHRQAVGRLLNVSDGVLSQALRMIVLITTTEPPGRLDPSLRRPGRQLADVRFTPLDRDEAARWCKERALAPLDRERTTLAELYAYEAGAELPSSPRHVGFAPAAP